MSDERPAFPSAFARQIEKFSTQQFIADGLLGRRATPVTDEQRAEYVARHAADRVATERARAELAEVAGPLGRLLRLHREESHTCAGCDYGGYEAEPPPYPCRTVELVAQLAGVALPERWVE